MEGVDPQEANPVPPPGPSWHAAFTWGATLADVERFAAEARSAGALDGAALHAGVTADGLIAGLSCPLEPGT